MTARYDADHSAAYHKDVEPLLRRLHELCIQHGLPLVAAVSHYRKTLDANDPRTGLPVTNINVTVMSNGDTSLMTDRMIAASLILHDGLLPALMQNAARIAAELAPHVRNGRLTVTPTETQAEILRAASAFGILLGSVQHAAPVIEMVGNLLGVLRNGPAPQEEQPAAPAKRAPRADDGDMDSTLADALRSLLDGLDL